MLIYQNAEGVHDQSKFGNPGTPASGVPHDKDHFKFLRKLKDFKYALSSDKHCNAYLCEMDTQHLQLIAVAIFLACPHYPIPS